MKIYLKDQKQNFKAHLDFMKNEEVMFYERSELIEKISTIIINPRIAFEELNFDFLFNYEISPKNIMSYKTQWKDENRKMKIGDSIVQQALIPPIKNFSQKIVFGVRVNDIIEQKFKKGFSYETLKGHVEKRISTFLIEQINDKTIFKIQTFSKPGNFLTKLFGNIFTVPYQTYCTRKALENVKNIIENQ